MALVNISQYHLIWQICLSYLANLFKLMIGQLVKLEAESNINV